MTIPGTCFAALLALCLLGSLGTWLMPARFASRWLATIGSIEAVAALFMGGGLLIGAGSFHLTLWPLLSLGVMELGADRLSGLFIVVSGLVFLPVSLFSSRYLTKYAAHHSLRYFNVLYHVLFFSIILILTAADAVSFLIAWEVMSIASYLLVVFEQREDSAHAGYVMVAMSELGTIAVLVAFVIAGAAAGTLGFAGIRAGAASLGHGAGIAILLLSFFGFAVKAGLLPLNNWLPLAHPAAPTNVSAMLSAVIVNLGIYGIIRVNLDLIPPQMPATGLLVLMIGSLSALIGILYATIQGELKRLLAHSTIENMGIVAAGVGASMVFLSTGHPVAASIALIAALYHLTNHSVYKSLLFIGTGLVERGAGTRDLDALGGLLRRMPWTGAFILVGILGISALPPLNGFVSEWLTLQTILRSVLLVSTPHKVVFAISGALLALTAGLAVTCFTKVFAMGFLGMARSEGAANAREAQPSTRWPLAILAAACLGLGILPTYVIPLLDGAAAPLVHSSATTALVPAFFGNTMAHADSATARPEERLPPAFLAEFHALGAQVGEHVLPGRGLVVLHRGAESNPVVFAMSTSYMFVVLAILIGASALVFRLLTRRQSVVRQGVWDGGLRRLWPALTYTATGFANPVRVVFRALLRPTAVEDSTQAVATNFRTAIRREYSEVDPVDRLLISPTIAALQWAATIVRRMHVGNVNVYAGYVLITLLLVLIVGLEFAH